MNEKLLYLENKLKAKLKCKHNDNAIVEKVK